MSDQQIIEETFTNNNVHPHAAAAANELIREGMTPAGMKAAMCYANPFPDKPVEPFLVPGGSKNCIPTAPRTQASVTKPATLTAGKTWGFALIEHPILMPNGTSYNEGRNYNSPGTLPTGAVPSTPLGSWFSGFAFDDDVTEIDLVGQTVSGGLSAALPAITFDTAKIPGTPIVKVVGQGLEVENTTPELYKGGSVTAARFDVVSEDSQLSYVANTDSLNMNWMAAWPYRFADVASNPSAVSWNASKGIYMPNCLRRDHQLKYSYNNWKPFMIGRTVPAIAQNPVRYVQGGIIDSGFAVKVAVFRGLAPESTFLVNMIMYFSTQQDSNSPLFPISQAEPAYDPKYDAFVNELSGPMPVATVFKGNALGSWFNDVCAVVSNIGSAVGSVLPGPIGTIASGIGKAAEWAGNFNAGYKNSGASGAATASQDNSQYDMVAICDAIEEGLERVSDYPKAVQKEIRAELRSRRFSGNSHSRVPPVLAENAAPRPQVLGRNYSVIGAAALGFEPDPRFTQAVTPAVLAQRSRKRFDLDALEFYNPRTHYRAGQPKPGFSKKQTQQRKPKQGPLTLEQAKFVQKAVKRKLAKAQKKRAKRMAKKGK